MSPLLNIQGTPGSTPSGHLHRHPEGGSLVSIRPTNTHKQGPSDRQSAVCSPGSTVSSQQSAHQQSADSRQSAHLARKQIEDRAMYDPRLVELVVEEVQHRGPRDHGRQALLQEVLNADAIGDLHPQPEPPHVVPKAGYDSIDLLDPHFGDDIFKSTPYQDWVVGGCGVKGGKNAEYKD